MAQTTTTTTTTMRDELDELTERMEGILYNTTNDADATENRTTMTAMPIPAPRPLVTPNTKDVRPWDQWAATGSAAEPISFPPPKIHRGRRVQVCCYIPDTGAHERLDNVLVNEERHMQSRDDRECAYYPIPHKKPIKTIMGYVQICAVLKRMDNEGSSLDEDEEDEIYVVQDFDDEDCVFELTDEYVAVKVNLDEKMRSLRNRHAEDPMKEIAALQLIGDSSSNVLGCRDVIYDATTQSINVVMRYFPHGDLFQMLQDVQHLNAETPGLTEPQARYWFRQILSGLDTLRKAGICHRDLSPENIMMDHDQCVIIDLGMCLRVPYTDGHGGTTSINTGNDKLLFNPQGACGKLPYMSPEIYKNRTSFDGEVADVWTAGTVLFCMLTGNRSYQRPHASDPQFYWMTRGLEHLLADWSVTLSPEGLHLLKNMLQVNPRLRLTLDEVMNHPWFDQPVEPMDLSEPIL